MLLAVDIGNSNIVAGIFKGKRLCGHFRIPTFHKNYPSFLKTIFCRSRVSPREIEGVVVASVVPAALRKFSPAVHNFLKIKPTVVGSDIIAPIKNRYRYPREVGQDRLVNAVAARHFYGLPVIVVDFGTAVTLDVVSRKGEYLGGIIVPGIDISLEALVSHTALLPRIKISRPRELLGRDTQGSMLSGIVFGLAALTDGLVEKLKKKYRLAGPVVATGGWAKLIASYCHEVRIVNPVLTLEGLRLTWESRTSKN